MSVWERIFHMVLFEALAVLLSVAGLWLLTDYHVVALSGMVVAISLIAMGWNFLFNWLFDYYVPGERVLRGWKVRFWHVVLFEGGLLLFTIPVVAYLLSINLYQAFIMDIGISLFIMLYAFVFNWCYNHLRAWLKNRH